MGVEHLADWNPTGVQCIVLGCGLQCPYCYLDDGELVHSSQCQGGHCKHMEA